jgi:hypothetical protein
MRRTPPVEIRQPPVALECVALNLNEFYLSKKSASKAANFDGRPLNDCRILGFFLLKATAKKCRIWAMTQLEALQMRPTSGHF